MPHALLWLLRRKARAQVRRALRVQGNPKRLVMLIIGVCAVLLWLGPTLLLSFTTPHTSSPLVLDIGPLALAGFALFSLLVSSGDGAIAFQPAEVDLLFPGPFTRRQLLAYKMLGGMIGSLPGAVIFSILFMRHAGSWWASFAGFILALWFIQFLGTAAALLKQTIGELAYTRTRRALLMLLLLALVGTVAWVVDSQQKIDPRELLTTINSSFAGRYLLAPFRVYVHIFGSHNVAEVARWVGLGVAINALLAVAVLRLDTNYLEASIRASERLAERLRRASTGNYFAPAPGSAPVRSRSIRLPAFLGEAAPICWRHWITMVRGGRRWLFQMVMLMVVAGVIVMGFRKTDTPPEALRWIGVGALVYITVILATVLRFDFRGDLDHLETLKTLPVSPTRIAVGELIMPLAILLSVQAIIIVVMATVFRWPAPFIVTAVCAAPVLNLLIVGVENTLFLLFPARLAHRGVADFSLMGRQLLLFLGKGIIYAITWGVSAALAFGVRMLTASDAAAALIGWCSLLGFGVASVLAAARAFSRFDVSSDMPA